MIATLKNYLQIVMTERTWSWTILGIFYLSFGLFIRGFFIQPLVSKAKDLNRNLHYDLRGDVNRRYLKKSVVGWFFFVIPLIIFALLWARAKLFPITVKDLLFVFAAVISYILSIMLHLQAFGIAYIESLKQKMEKDNSLGL
jgi:hypothetical protein